MHTIIYQRKEEYGFNKYHSLKGKKLVEKLLTDYMQEVKTFTFRDIKEYYLWLESTRVFSGRKYGFTRGQLLVYLRQLKLNGDLKSYKKNNQIIYEWNKVI